MNPQLPPTSASAKAAQQRVAPAGEFHIPSLDGIRAISFLLVFVAHAGLGHIVPGGFGVTIFFFVSGYLITTLLRLERDRTGTNSLRDFYLRRVFRILPPFYVVLGVALLLSALGLLVEPLRLGSVVAQLTHITNYWYIFRDEHGFPSGTVVYWSLAVEEHFYLVFPWLFISLQRRWPAAGQRQAALLLALCALVLVWRLVLVLVLHAPGVRTGIATDTRIDSILFGCALAVYGNPMLDPWKGSKKLWLYLLLPLGAALLVLSFLAPDACFRETLRYSLQGLGLVPFFVVAIRHPELLPVRLLNAPLLRRFGQLSYALYLIHQVVLTVIEKYWPGLDKLSTGLLTLALSYAFAAAVQRWVEQPSARLRRRWVTTHWLKATPSVQVQPESVRDAARATL